MPKNQLLGISALSFCMLSFLSQGGGCLHNPKPLPSVTISPNPVAFPATALGASSAPIPVTITNSGTAALVISSIVAGGSNPGDFTSTNTCSGPVASMGTCTITVTFIPTAPGQRSETITLTDNASDSPQVIQVNGTANAIAISLTPPQSAIATDQAVQFSATGDPAGVTFSLAAFTNSGPGAAAPAGTINATGYYTPPPGSPSLYVIVTATSKTDPTKSATATVNVVAPGLFANTNNVQVAQYSVSTPASANVSVQF
ncbi:MAG: choice-of-anchor D domain-containing protein, partial [Candidatus Acidiferrum sp.]